MSKKKCSYNDRNGFAYIYVNRKPVALKAPDSIVQPMVYFATYGLFCGSAHLRERNLVCYLRSHCTCRSHAFLI